MTPVAVLRAVSGGVPLPLHRFLRRISAASVTAADLPDLKHYKEAFARRMSMAGLKHHHRIAVGVSGGPDSMALCMLAVGWKLEGGNRSNDENGLVDGLLGIVVDHKLRPESSDEAQLVCDRVLKMGIKCEVACCEWPDGKPKQGHVQEMAREMRYQILRNVCIKENIGVLLIAHHADDQAELFILRLSRNSGTLGLAGMPFVSQLFSNDSSNASEVFTQYGILLVRPVLEFSKKDMYKICMEGHQEWVEDPTNQSQLYARNRIRYSLKDLMPCEFRSEIQALISMYRLTRTSVEDVAQRLISHSVEIKDQGYVVIDLQKLEPWNVQDLCLSRFLSLVLQFTSQRHRPIRGNISQLLMDYIRNIPCKSSLTAAGCYLCAAPKSKGTKVLVCCSPDSPVSPRMRLSYLCTHMENTSSLPLEIDQITMRARIHSEKLLKEPSVDPLLNLTSTQDILSEARKLNILSESTVSSMVSLQLKEAKCFRTKAEIQAHDHSSSAMRSEVGSSIFLHPCQSCHFTSRFIVTWKQSEETRELSQDQEYTCHFCTANQEKAVTVRHMVDDDWLYLTKLSNIKAPEDSYGHGCSLILQHKLDIKSQKEYFEQMQLSAQNAIQALRLIPLPARRALPLITDSYGLPISIPAIQARSCPRQRCARRDRALLSRLLGSIVETFREFGFENVVGYELADLSSDLGNPKCSDIANYETTTSSGIAQEGCIHSLGS